MKFLLDTNVIYELRKVGDGKADANVTRWISAQDSSDLFISAITILEIERGILSLERRDGYQGARLRKWMDSRVRPEFEGRILPVDDTIATRCAGLTLRGLSDKLDHRRPADGTRIAAGVVPARSLALPQRARAPSLASSYRATPWGVPRRN